MKKVFLLAAVAFATSANAQVVQFDSETMGMTDTAAEFAAETALGSNDAIDAYIAFTDNYKASNIKNNDYNVVKIGGNEVLTKGGMQGSNNPKDVNGNSPAGNVAEGTAPSVPVSGCVYGITAKADGIVYVVAKLSSNKAYTVFEDGAAIGYKAAMEANNAAFADGKLFVEVKGEGEYNLVKTPIDWLERIATGDPASEIKVNGLGVIWFPVYNGGKYLVNACGSKASVSGMYFATAEQDVVVEGTDSEAPKDAFTIYTAGGADGIANVAATKAENARMFNLAGQEVGKNFKGIVVVNGKKFMNK
ncbi:MAG: hypothetical protein II758_05545 [Prevotella sp.]|nr:hypothetical protein [Prevotella sp.]